MTIMTTGGHCCVCTRVCMHIGGPYLCDEHKTPKISTTPVSPTYEPLPAFGGLIAAERDQYRAERDQARAELAEYKQRALASYEAKVQDFAAETLRSSRLIAEVAALRQQLDEALAQVANTTSMFNDEVRWRNLANAKVEELHREREALRRELDEARAELQRQTAITEEVSEARRVTDIQARDLFLACASLTAERDAARAELREGLNERDLLTDTAPDRLVAEVLALIDRGYQQYTELRSLYVDQLADNARLLDVYRAAEAWADSWARTATGRSFEPGTHDALIAAVDSYHSAAPAEPAPRVRVCPPECDWHPAKDGDTPGELVPGEGEVPQPIRAGTPAEAPGVVSAPLISAEDPPSPQPLRMKFAYTIPGLAGAWRLMGLETTGMAADGQAALRMVRVDDPAEAPDGERP